MPFSAPTAYEAKSFSRAVWRTVFQAQLDFIGHQNDMLHSAPGNGYLLFAAILDVIRCAAMGMAITLVLILGCLHSPLPTGPVISAAAVQATRFVYSGDLIRHRFLRL